jgi:hypothetical protein
MNGMMMAAIATKAANKGMFKSKSGKTGKAPAQGRSLLSAFDGSGSIGMPRLKKKKKRLVESPAPVSNGYSRTLG